MLRIWAVFLAVIFAGSGFARDPAELPPTDFTAPQYIDSKGCVFLRDDGGGWKPRLYRDGTTVCGYPPSMSARRLAPEGSARLFPDMSPAPARADQIERALTLQIIPDLQTGELAGEREPLVPLLDMGPEPASQEPVQMLADAAKALPRLRAAMGRGLQPNKKLCKLLEYGPSVAAAQGLGLDPTEGFCDGLSRNQLAKLAFARPANLPPTPRVRAVAPVAQGAVAPNSATRTRPSGLGGARPGKAGVRLHTAQPAPPRTTPFQTPRFIWIGSFQTDQQMASVAGQVAALQLPMVRQKPSQPGGGPFILLAGPFDERQALVIALDRIRRAGFPRAAPL